MPNGNQYNKKTVLFTQAVQATGLTQGKRTVQRYKDAMAARGQAIQVRDLKVADRATLPALRLLWPPK